MAMHNGCFYLHILNISILASFPYLVYKLLSLALWRMRVQALGLQQSLLLKIYQLYDTIACIEEFLTSS